MQDNKQTQETVVYNKYTQDIVYGSAPTGGDIICSAPIEWERSMARWAEHRDFIMEAFNVKAESGKGPKELAERNKFLEGFLHIKNADKAIAENKALAERVKELETALQNLHESVPGQTKDSDWWGDDLKTAMDNAKNLLNL